MKNGHVVSKLAPHNGVLVIITDILHTGADIVKEFAGRDFAVAVAVGLSAKATLHHHKMRKQSVGKTLSFG